MLRLGRVRSSLRQAARKSFDGGTRDSTVQGHAALGDHVSQTALCVAVERRPDLFRRGGIRAWQHGSAKVLLVIGRRHLFGKSVTKAWQAGLSVPSSPR